MNAFDAQGPTNGVAMPFHVLEAVAAALNRPDAAEGMGLALDALLAGLDMRAGALYVLDEETRELHATPHSRGVSPEYARAVARFRQGEGLLGRALEGRAPVVVEDLASMPEARDATREIGLRTVVFVPLFARGRANGVLALGGFTARTITPDELKLLEVSGSLLGGAFDAARLLERSGRHRAQLQALWEIDRAMIEDRDLPEILEVVVREAALLGRGHAAIALIEGDHGLRIAGAHGTDALEVLGNPPTLAGTPVASLLMAAGPATVRVDLHGGSGRALVVPLLAGDRPIGGLVVVKLEREWREEDLTVLATFGQRAAVALAKARARDAENRRASQLALVSAAAEIAASTLDVKPLLGAIARYIQRSFGYYSVSVYLAEPETREVVLAGASGAALSMPKGHRMSFGTGIVGWVAEHGEYLLANNVRMEPRYKPAAMAETQAELAVPVRLAGEVVAVINVESDRAESFDDGDVVALDGIASQVASSIRNARLFEEKVRALRNLEILQEITNVLNSDLDLDALLDRIARRSVEAVRPAQMGAVLLYDGEALGVRSSHGYTEPGVLKRVRMLFSEGLPGSVFVSGQGRLVRSSPADYGRHAAAFEEAAAGANRVALLCVPVSLPQEKLGVLLLESATQPESFYAGDLRFATTLANQAAIAIGNALRLRRILEMDRQRQEYLSNVSHELRTPLTVIQGYVEALASGAAGEQAAQFLAVAEEQCLRLGRMIDEILEVSRLEQGVAQRHLEWAPVVLSSVLRKVLQVMRQELLFKGLSLNERIAASVPPMPGDERLLHMLLLNLLENAVKFTPRGGTVGVELAHQGNELVVRVSDNGIGIPPEHHERIFEKFFMVDGGDRRNQGGTGIGLYLVREVVAIHDGTLRVDSFPGKGATFEVRLPLRPR